MWFLLYAYFAEPTITLKGEEEVTIKLNEKFIDSGATAMLDNKDISKTIKVTNNIKANVVGDYEVVYSVTNTKGKKEKKVTRIVKVRDDIKPVIKLKKGSVYKVQYGTNYKEPGYTATDNYDGNITKKVKVTGNVDTNKLGMYKLYYSVTDSSSNNTVKTRTVKVVDETPPVIKLLGKERTVIKVGEPFLDHGYTATDNHDGDITDKVYSKGKVNPKVAGVYHISYSVEDSFGNFATIERTVQVGTQSDIDEDNYIMVSIEKQKLWFYKKGKLKLTSNVVTGHKNMWDTKKGSFRIRSKNYQIYLIGADYRTFVNYWMLIDSSTQIGLHDATWRDSFGGSIYKSNGSHGCVNLPYSVAQYIYQNAKVGTLVLIY